MTVIPEQSPANTGIRSLPRNVWAVSLTSFFNDIASEMVLYMLPLYLANVMGASTGVIGLIEGVAESTASLLKLFSGWVSDRVGDRKWLAVGGYALSTFTRPFFYLAQTWLGIAVVRWADRVGKGIRTAPRDALVADSVDERSRGIAFGLHRAADTAGATLGLLLALVVVWLMQSGAAKLDASTFRAIVLLSMVPAILGVLTLAIGARNVPVVGRRASPQFTLTLLGRPFLAFLVIISIFELGNSSDAFLVLRAQDLGATVTGVLAMLVVFNLVYTLVSTPAGSISDRIGRRKVIIAGWLVYALVYLGFGLAGSSAQVWMLFVIYGLYYGMAFGTSKAMIADLVVPEVRGSAYGTYNAAIGILDFPASLIAGLLWQGAGRWSGFGPAAPFLFGALMALIAAGLMAIWLPRVSRKTA